MRFTLEGVGDLEVTAGTPLARCRDALDRLAGHPVPQLHVSGVPLAAEHAAGVPPWTAGSRVGRGAAVSATSSPTSAASAAAAPWHLAVVAGPDAGAVIGPGRDGRVRVGRVRTGRPGDRAPGRLELTDPAVSRRHLTVRARRRGWTVADGGSANGSVLVRERRGRGRRAHRLLPRRARRLRPGDRVHLGGSVVELRVADGGPRRDPRPAGEEGVPGPSPVRVPAASWLVPLATSAMLAAALRNPVFLLLGLTGPASTAVTGLADRRRGRAHAHRHGPEEPDLGPDAAAVTLLVGSRTAAASPGPAAAPPGWWAYAARGLAVVGDRPDVLAVARAMLGTALLDPDLTLALLHPGDAAWSACRWAEGALGSAPEARVGCDAASAAQALAAGPRLVVSDGTTPWRAALDHWWLTVRTSRDAVLVLAPDRAGVPAWCPWVISVDRRGGATLTGPDGTRDVRVPRGSSPWFEAHLRALAALGPVADAGRSAPPAALPRQVGLAELHVPCDVDAVQRAWRTADGRTLTLPLGAGARGPVVVDLVREGPHALVAGTTGSGKSELLQSMVLALAAQYPPSLLAVVLVDYKGGAGLGRCAPLPHVVGQVTDLDSAAAMRSLHGLRTELRRREELLAAAGATDLRDLAGSPDAPPRLLVVVDEFRAMSEDLPDFVPGLVRLAAQGRSLGMHLVLATQRPGGAVSPQMRANLALRVCLRVMESTDSLDVLDEPGAADLPADVPGRALVRAGGGVTAVQTPWAALPPARATEVVRPALPWAAFGRAREPVGPDAGHVAHLVTLARRAAADAGLPPPRPVWTPDLPPVVGPAELTSVGPAAPGAVLLGIVDRPHALTRGPLCWEPCGLLAVVGRPGSGRTTATATAGRAVLAAGGHVHVAHGAPGRPEAWWRDPAVRSADGLGTVVGADDPRRLARLLTVLLTGEAGAPGTPGPAGRGAAPCVLVLDDLTVVMRALEALPAGPELLDRVLRECRHRGLGVVAAGRPADLARILPWADRRLVLATADAAEEALAGVPRDLTGGREVPGRAVHLGAGPAERCQVAVRALGDPATGVPPPVRIRPLPRRVTSFGDAAPGATGPLLGLGGDAAAHVAVDITRGVLVVGPGGSGRSTALAVLAAGLAPGPVAVIAAEGPLAAFAERTGCWGAARPGDAEALLRRCRASSDRPVAVLVDDVDLLGRAGVLDDELAAWVTAREAGEDLPPVLAAARTDRAAAAYRGAVAALRTSAAVVVLCPEEPGSSEVAGTGLGAVVDPTRLRHPGYAAVVARGLAVPVQVTTVSGAPCASRPG